MELVQGYGISSGTEARSESPKGWQCADPQVICGIEHSGGSAFEMEGFEWRNILAANGLDLSGISENARGSPRRSSRAWCHSFKKAARVCTPSGDRSIHGVAGKRP